MFKTLPKIDQSYRASLHVVTPDWMGEKWKTHDRCFLGISLGNPNMRRPKLDATVHWIAKNFKKCGVVIGDYPHRLTLQVLMDITEQEALEMALTQGRVFIDENRPFFEDIEGCEFEFLSCLDIQKKPSFNAFYNHLLSVFESDAAFSNSVRRDAETFLNRQIRRKSHKAEIEHWRKLCISYLIEEMAIYATLSASGWMVEVYPGQELSTLVEVAEGQHPGVSQELCQRINLSLRIRKK